MTAIINYPPKDFFFCSTHLKFHLLQRSQNTSKVCCYCCEAIWCDPHSLGDAKKHVLKCSERTNLPPAPALHNTLTCVSVGYILSYNYTLFELYSLLHFLQTALSSHLLTLTLGLGFQPQRTQSIRPLWGVFCSSMLLVPSLR